MDGPRNRSLRSAHARVCSWRSFLPEDRARLKRARRSLNELAGSDHAAEIPVRRAILQNFSPGESGLSGPRWIAAVVSTALDSAHHGTQQETAELESRRNR